MAYAAGLQQWHTPRKRCSSCSYAAAQGQWFCSIACTWSQRPSHCHAATDPAQDKEGKAAHMLPVRAAAMHACTIRCACSHCCSPNRHFPWQLAAEATTDAQLHGSASICAGRLDKPCKSEQVWCWSRTIAKQPGCASSTPSRQKTAMRMHIST